MIIEYTLDPNQKLTEEQVQEIQDAKKAPIVFDEDCPELSPRMIKAFECLIADRKRRGTNVTKSKE